MLVDLASYALDQLTGSSAGSDAKTAILQQQIAALRQENAQLRADNAELERLGNALADRLQRAVAKIRQLTGQPAPQPQPQPVAQPIPAREQVVDVGGGTFQQAEAAPAPEPATAEERRKAKQSWRKLDLWAGDEVDAMIGGAP